MKSVSLALAAHLEDDVTTLATCWHIARRDGVEFFFTDHDKDLLVDGDTYLSAFGYSRTAIENDVSMAVDNLDVVGFLDSDTITETDLRAGAYDFAEVFVFIVNWNDLSQGILKQRRGWLGEVTMSENGIFKAELRGLTQALSQRIGEVYSPECRADLGDSRCKIPIEPPLIARSTLYSVGQFVRVITDSGETGQPQFENRIYEVTRDGTTGPSQPTFDTDVDDTTIDTDIKATSILTFTGQPANAQTCTIGGKVYTAQTVLTNVNGNFLIGGTFQDTVANLLAAMTLGAGAGTLYAAATTAHTTVDFAANGTNAIDLSAKVAGSAGNAITLAENMNNAVFAAPTNHLAGGVDGAEFTAREAWTRAAVVTAIGVKAAGLLTMTGQPGNNQTFTIGSKTYTMQTTLTNVNGNIHIGANTAATQLNILNAITLLGGVVGTDYATAMTAHPTVDAYQGTGTTIRIEAKAGGATGNSIVTTEGLNNAIFGAGTLLGGAADRKVLYIDVDEPRADDGWFNGGAFIFETGDNDGRMVEVKGWIEETGKITLFLPTPYPVEVGDEARLYPGCDKRLATCIDVFDNVLNFRGEPYIPGQDDILKYPDAK